MKKIIENLMEGNQNVPTFFQSAAIKWKEFLADISEINDDVLASRLTAGQYWFEDNCGGRWLGQEIMAITGFAAVNKIDDIDAGKNSDKLADAFIKSDCSGELKANARRAATNYGQNEE